MSQGWKRLTGLALLLLLAAAGFCFLRWLQTGREYRQAESCYLSLEQEVIRPAEDSETMPAEEREQAEPGPETAARIPGEGEEDRSLCPPVTVDWQSLLAVNPDTVAWLYCPDLLSLPVACSGDNTWYLSHLIDGRESFSGCLFVEAANKRDFRDTNTVIYGHNMNDGSMLQQLPCYAGQAWYEAHPVMWLLTPEGDYRVDLFSGYTTAEGSAACRIYARPDASYASFLKEIAGKSDFLPSVLPGEDTVRILTLSTCSYAFRDARYVLHGILVPAGGTPGNGEESGPGGKE